jgi:hypothetical protein
MKKEYVLVECIGTYRMRYMVEVPEGKPEYALDTVACDEANEFSQKYLGEQVFSHRVLSKEDVLKLCDEDNEYCQLWPDKKKIETFVTEWSEDGKN